jgi:hypothetical protein
VRPTGGLFVYIHSFRGGFGGKGLAKALRLLNLSEERLHSSRIEY